MHASVVNGLDNARPSKNLRKLVDDLSQRTGGAAYEVKKPGHIERVFHEISEDLWLKLR